MSTSPDEAARIHATAIIEAGVHVGGGTAVWDSVHLRAGARVGNDCVVGEKSYLGPGVLVGSRVKINAFVYVCSGVVIEDGVMVSAGTIFTNDQYPRAATPDLAALLPSQLPHGAVTTRICEGASIGAAAVIGSGIRIGRFAMVGMGSIVTRPVPDFHLVVGQPARAVGTVCRCGRPTIRFEGQPPEAMSAACPRCERRYRFYKGLVTELSHPSAAG